MTEFAKTQEKGKNQGRLKYAIIQGLIFSVVVTIIKDRALIWGSLTGASNEIGTILINFSWLVAGGIIGFYTITWWWKEKYNKVEIEHQIQRRFN